MHSHYSLAVLTTWFHIVDINSPFFRNNYGNIEELIGTGNKDKPVFK